MWGKVQGFVWWPCTEVSVCEDILDRYLSLPGLLPPRGRPNVHFTSLRERGAIRIAPPLERLRISSPSLVRIGLPCLQNGLVTRA